MIRLENELAKGPTIPSDAVWSSSDTALVFPIKGFHVCRCRGEIEESENSRPSQHCRCNSLARNLVLEHVELRM